MTAKEFFQTNDLFTVSSDGTIRAFDGAASALVSCNEKFGSITIVDKADTVCTRCGGAGGFSGWPGYTCFRCLGNGIDPKPGTRKLYTQDRAEKLSAKRIEARAKKEAEGRAIMAARNAAFDKLVTEHPVMGELKEIIANLWAQKDANEEFNIPAGIMISEDIFDSIRRAGRITERQLEALQGILVRYKATEERKALMTHVGTVGEKMQLALTLKFETAFHGIYGTTFIQSFEDSAGNCIIYKGSAPMSIEKCETKEIKFTVKKHDDYKGKPQTVMIRPKVVAA